MATVDVAIASRASRTSGQGWRHDRALLYFLSFSAMAVSIASVAWTGDEVAAPVLLTILAGLGHLVSASGKGRRLRLGLLIYPTVFLLAWVMRDGLIAVVTTGSLCRLTGFLIVLQALASFNLRSVRTLYDTLLLSLVVLLLASEGALSIQFGLFLLTFGVIAIAFLISANIESLAGGVRRVAATGNLHVVAAGIVLLLLVLSISFMVFLALPQSARVHNAQPLPSRLDPTLSPPPLPLEVSGVMQRSQRAFSPHVKRRSTTAHRQRMCPPRWVKRHRLMGSHLKLRPRRSTERFQEATPLLSGPCPSTRRQVSAICWMVPPGCRLPPLAIRTWDTWGTRAETWSCTYVARSQATGVARY